ncbi:unnamed protein product [Ranitomeya imitator]|uniref:Uncharacterized protein n=1 Tax=Ranitomeya imitator TaxID=111125 RepID=A0ABN9L753_9NEOB|nr:unnamed protein product [Ranitomeya imitator]
MYGANTDRRGYSKLSATVYSRQLLDCHLYGEAILLYLRDDYDKEVKQAKEKQRKRHTPGPSRPRKPDLQVYHPHPRERPSRTTDRADDDLTDSDSSTDPENPANQLFCLEFEADGGQVTSVVVYEDDDAEQIATKISVENQLETRMKEALKRRIQEEIAKRSVHR